MTGKNQIGNESKAEGTVKFRTFNPQTNTENDQVFTEATDVEIHEAVSLANEAFGEFRAMSGERIGAFLDAIADEILALDDALVQVYMNESGLPEGRAKGERGRTIFQLRTFADLVREGSWVEARIDTAIPDRTPAPKVDLRKMMIGLGPIVVFGASNFPLAYSTAGGDTASALAAGCPVIVKGHPMHAGTSELVASAIIKAAEKTGMPNGVFSNLNSRGIEVGTKLVKHPEVKGVGFTGSIRGGRALFDLAAKRKEPIPVFAEMGSINPVILMPNYLEKNKDSIAKTYAGSITLGTGQFCTNPGLILGVKSDTLTSFMDTLGNEITEIKPSCMLHPTIASNFESGKLKLLQQDGTKIVNHAILTSEPNYAQQGIATVDGSTFLNNPSLHEEIFGPFSLVIQCDDLDQLTRIIEGLEGQLTGTILTEESEIADRPGIVRAMQDRVGRLIFNSVPTGVEVCPSMLHGGPYPASTDSRFTAVGTDSIQRWIRPVSYQDWPNELLPPELKNENPLGISRKVNNVDTRDAIS
ncbi:MAG: aldehyde dehydrogenase (NADP(+)) [Crocinitomicaceae bacterium]|nr:aldehyde dehydrogenase (NADP(+)) [Crocinitomicaceae bacterium]